MLTCVIALAPTATRAGSTLLDEVIVTAGRIARPAQLVPTSATALSRDDLVQRDLVTARDLATVVPNLSWSGTDGGLVGSVFIRGVGSPSIHSNQLGAVGLYADDVTLNAPLLANLALLDVARVEVLRGPWNASLGRNASAGAVRFVSRAPVPGADASAETLVRIGTSGRLDVELATGFSIGESNAARLAFAVESLDDYADNLTRARDEGGHERMTARARWRREVADGTDRRRRSARESHRGRFHPLQADWTWDARQPWTFQLSFSRRRPQPRKRLRRSDRVCGQRRVR